MPRKNDITYFAKTHYRNNEKIFGIQRKDRRQHMYILGKSGMGKSTLISNMLLQDIRNGEGVCIVDPHGELVEDLLGVIPKERLDDVVYFNPSDIEYHVGFNVLEVYDERYKHLVASGIMGIFTKIWANVWSSRMEYILNNCILALIDTPGTTLLGIPRLLVDKDYRQKIVNNIKDPVVRTFWVHEYEAWEDRYRKEAIAPIQNKVGQFLSSSIIRNILGQPQSTINIPEIMDKQKIFLVNLSKGRVGEDNSALLGAMLITKLQLAAMERVKVAEHARKDFYLYVDEFQNFVTDSFATILSEARKYRLNLIIAHQYIAQLESEGNTTVRDAVFGNVGTMIIGRVGAADAAFLETEFMPEFTPDDFVSLPNFHVYLKLLVNGMTTRPFSAKTLPPIVKMERRPKVEQYIVARSRKLYHRPRQEVEADINRWSNEEEDAASVEVDENGLGADGKYRMPCSFDDCDHIAVVPFKPEPGRPVYCRDCIGKIKKGDKKPITSNNKGDKPILRQASKEGLAALGIEFESKNRNMDKDRSQPKRPSRNNSPRNNKNEGRRRRNDSKPNHPQTPRPTKKNDFVPTPKKRTPPDRAGLQDLLKDAFKDIDFQKETEAPKKEAQPVAKTLEKEKQKTISLGDLAKSATKEEVVDLEQEYRNKGLKPKEELGKPRFDPSKKADNTKVSALKAALAKAGKVKKDEPAEAPKTDILKEQATPEPAKVITDEEVDKLLAQAEEKVQTKEEKPDEEKGLPTLQEIKEASKIELPEIPETDNEPQKEDPKEVPEGILRKILEDDDD